MGATRFLLAIIVILGHSQAPLKTFGGGGAVEAFYILSGTFMSAAYSRNYAGMPGAGLRFFVSRYTRLWPSYAVIFLLTYLTFLAFGDQGNHTGIYTYFMQPQPWYISASNFTLIGQDVLSIHSPTDLTFPVRQSWSIAAELVFYALVPILFRLGSKVTWVLFASLAVKILIQPNYPLYMDLYFFKMSVDGFRLSYFPFWSGLFFFTLGFYLRQIGGRAKFIDRETANILKPLAVALFCLVAIFPQDSSWFLSEGQHGNILVDLSVIFLTANFFDAQETKFERWLGAISYHVYISQFLFIQLTADPVRNTPIPRFGGYIGALTSTFVVIACCIGYAAAFEYLAQGRIDRWRARFLKTRNALYGSQQLRTSPSS